MGEGDVLCAFWEMSKLQNSQVKNDPNVSGCFKGRHYGLFEDYGPDIVKHGSQ